METTEEVTKRGGKFETRNKRTKGNYNKKSQIISIVKINQARIVQQKDVHLLTCKNNITIVESGTSCLKL